MIGCGGLGAGICGRLGGRFGHRGSELFRLDRILVGLEGGREFRNSLAGGKGEGAVSQAGPAICLRKFLGDFLIHPEGGFRFLVPTENFGKFHHNAETVLAFLLPQEIEILLVQMGGILLFVQIPENIGTALQDDFIFRKILQKLVDGGAGFGDGTGVGKETGFAESEPGEIGRFGRLGGIEVFVKVPRERAIEGIADKGDHPGESDLGLVGGFGEGEAGQEAADKEADVGGKAEIRLIDGAHGGGDAVREEGTDPVFRLGANRVGTEGVDMVRDGPFPEMGGGKLEGAFEVPGVPTRVEGDLVPRNPFRCDLGFPIDFDIEPAGLKENGGLLDPVVPHAVGVVFFLDGPNIKECASRELRFFGFNGILDHAADDVRSGTIESGDEDEVVGKKLTERADPFVGEVGVGDEAVGGEPAEGEEGEFGIDGGGVWAELGHESFRGNHGGVFGDFERDATDENHDPDRVLLGLLDGEVVGEAQDGVGEDGFAAFQPSAGHKKLVQGLADFGFEVHAGNFLGDGTIDAEQAIGRNGAGFGIRFGQGLGIGVGPVVNDDRMRGQIGGL